MAAIVRINLVWKIQSFASFCLTVATLVVSIGVSTLPERADAEELNDIVFFDLRLMGADLIDEMIYSWISNKDLAGPIDLVLAEVVAPIGLDGRFIDMVENRFYEVMRNNPDLKVNLVHCGLCRQFTVKSNRIGTVISRGIDQPEVFEKLTANFSGRKALSLNFEVERRELVLRASIFDFDVSQRIRWAGRYSTSRSARRLLRQSTPLISLEEARKEQRLILEGRDRAQLATRLTIRNFSSDLPVTQPLMFVEQSFEAIPLPARNRRAAITFGFTSLKSLMEGWSIGGHFASLLFNDKPSLTQPDLYWFLGFHYVRIRGPGAEPFAREQLDIDRLLNDLAEPKASLVTWRIGLETHIKYRLGATAFIEYVPVLKDSNIFSEELLGDILPYHNWGIGVLVRW